MKRIALLLTTCVWLLIVRAALAQGTLPSSYVTPSSSGSPNSVAVVWPYEFVSVQNSSGSVGQIFTYNISTGSQVYVGAYTTPCAYPNGMVVTNIAGVNVMAFGCYDTGSLLTLTVSSDGSLSALGSVSGLTAPYPGIAIDGTNVLIPLFGSTGTVNGSVAKVSIATPSSPSITGTVALASPASGVYVNPAYLAVAGGYIYVEAGAEGGNSTIQVVNESTMSLVGTPFLVAHSPQYITIQGSVAFVTLYDAEEFEAINISNPASLSMLQTISTTLPTASCGPIPVIVRDNYAYIGCYAGSAIITVDINNPTDMRETQYYDGFSNPQRFRLAGRYLLATNSVSGGNVYQIDTGGSYQNQIDANSIYGTYIQAGNLNASSASVTNNLSVQGAAYLGLGSTVGGSLICTSANGECPGITALTADVTATGPGSVAATVTGVHATSGTLNGVTVGAITPEAGSFTSLGAQSAAIADTQNAPTGISISNSSSGNIAQAVYYANSDSASMTAGATSSGVFSIPSIAYVNAHTGNALEFLFHDAIAGSFTSSGFSVGASNQFQVDGGGNVTAGAGNFASLATQSVSVSDTQNAPTTMNLNNSSSGTGAQAVYFATSDAASMTTGATSSGFTGLPSVAYINAHSGNALEFLFHDAVAGSFTSTGFGVGATNQFQVDTSGNVTANSAIYGGTVTMPQTLGPMEAPIPGSSCPTSGAWVFSQDGHASFCSGGAWVTKI